MAVDELTSPHWGAFVRYTGSGRVTKLEPGKRNVYVEVSAEDLRYPMRAFYDGKNAELDALARQAFEDGLRVEYVIDAHRLRGAPADVPVDQLENDQKVRDLTGLAQLDGQGRRRRWAGMPFDAEQVARNATDPVRVEGQQNGRQRRQETPPAADPAPAPQGQPEATAAPPERPKGVTVGEVESYAMTAAVGTFSWAFELTLAHNQHDRETTPSGRPATPSWDTVARLGGLLLEAADQIQAGVRPDRKVDRQAASHTRARGALRTVLPAHPVPWGVKRTADLQAWQNALVNSATRLLQLAAANIDPREG